MNGRGIRAVTVPVTAAGSTVVAVTAPHRLCGWSLQAAAAAGLSATGTSTAPAAGATIASVAAVPAGEYTVNWLVQLTGTPGVGELNNVGLYVGATLVATSVNQGAAGDYQQQPMQIVVPAGGATVALKAIGAGTAGAVYDVQATLTGGPDSQCLIMDAGQVQGVSGPLATTSDTQWLTDEGIFVSSNTSVQVTQGTVSGVVYIIPLDDSA